MGSIACHECLPHHQCRGSQQPIEHGNWSSLSFSRRGDCPPSHRHLQIRNQNPASKAARKILLNPLLQTPALPTGRQLAHALLEFAQGNDTEKERQLLLGIEPREHFGSNSRRVTTPSNDLALPVAFS